MLRLRTFKYVTREDAGVRMFNRHLTRKLASLAVFIAVGLGLQLVVTSPASAALPRCNANGLFNSTWSPGSQAWLPRYWQTDSSACILRRGDRNEGVGELQLNLRDGYGQSIAVDNVFGPATERALRNVQRVLGITADGIYGPQTRDHICWIKYRQSSACIWMNNNH
jgi:hypothetical protein